MGSKAATERSIYREMAVYPAIEKGIVLALEASTPVTDYVGTRIFRQLAPPQTDYPFIMFKHVHGGLHQDSPRPTLDLRYRIECVAESWEAADQGSARIQAALHTAPLTIDGWDNFDTFSGGKYVQAEVTETQTFYHVGMFYRIRAAALD